MDGASNAKLKRLKIYDTRTTIEDFETHGPHGTREGETSPRIPITKISLSKCSINITGDLRNREDRKGSPRGPVTKVGLIKHATRNLTPSKLNRILRKGRRVLNFLTYISLERTKSIFTDDEIEISNPRDIRDTIEKYLNEQDKSRSKDLLSLIYFQLYSVVSSDIDETFIRDFFQEIVHVDFTDGCDRMNLYEFTINLYDRSSKWYALMCLFLSKICQPHSHHISYSLFQSRKPGTNRRVRNMYRVFHLLYDIYNRIPEWCEYQIGVPPISTTQNKMLSSTLLEVPTNRTPASCSRSR